MVDRLLFVDGTTWNRARILTTAYSQLASGSADTLWGSDQAESFSGGPGNDVIDPRGGNDTISGESGDDIIFEGDGDDTVVWNVGDGHDTLTGGYSWDGLDTLLLGSGITLSDLRFGYFGQGGAGVRVSFANQSGSVSFDQMLGTGESQLDQIKLADGTALDRQQIVNALHLQGTTPGADHAWGSELNESFATGVGNDTIDPRGGNDTVVGGPGDDTIIESAGSDIYRWNVGDGDDIITGFEESGGLNVIELGVGVSPTSTVVSRSGVDGLGLMISFTNQAGSILLDGQWNISTGQGVDQLRFADGTVWNRTAMKARTVAISEASDWINGTSSADTIHGLGGNDIILGENGNDLLYGDAGNDALYGGIGTDTLHGGEGDDTLVGGASDDVLNGGAGNDRFLSAGTGTDAYDVVDGGLGTDSIVATGEYVAIGLKGITGVEVISGGGFDGVTVAGSTLADTLDFTGVSFSGIQSIDGGGGNDVIIGSSGTDNLLGNAGNDTLNGGQGADALTGGTGDDILNGGDGDDVFKVDGTGEGFDAIDGGAGSDTLLATAESTVFGLKSLSGVEIVSSDGWDSVSILGTTLGDSFDFTTVTLSGIQKIDVGSGNDVLIGSAAADWMIGNAGNDMLTGGLGNDVLDGGVGTDTLNGGLGDDTLIGGANDDVMNGGDGNDVFQFAGTGQGFETIDGGGGMDTIAATAGDTVIGLASLTGIEAITGDGNGNVTILGTANNDTFDFSTMTLTDIAKIDMGSGNDTVTGSSIADWLVGGAGNDVIAGGAGNDLIDGGSNVDTADYRYSAAAWTINLTATADQAQSGSEIDTLIGIENVNGGAGSDTITGNSGANVLAGYGGSDTILGGSGNDALQGGDGNDRLTGGTGNDTIDGGLGADVAVFAGAQATYSITTSGGTVQIVDNATSTDGNDGTDTLIGVEKAEFKGGSQVTLAVPIVLDLDGDGVTLVHRGQSKAKFDWDGNSKRDDTGWIGKRDGFLMLDRNGDGKVSGANELSFVDDKPGAKSDLDGLSAFDTNHDGVFSAADARFSEFRIWRDADGDGKSDKGELMTLARAGVASINLRGTATEQSWDWGDNITINSGSFTRTNGSVGALGDVALSYNATKTKAERRLDGLNAKLIHPNFHTPGSAAARLVEGMAGFQDKRGVASIDWQPDTADRRELLAVASTQFGA